MGAKACKDVNGAASTVAREHGGVQVTFKKHLSDTGSYLDDEWGPLVRVCEETSAGNSVHNKAIHMTIHRIVHPSMDSFLSTGLSCR